LAKNLTHFKHRTQITVLALQLHQHFIIFLERLKLKAFRRELFQLTSTANSN